MGLKEILKSTTKLTIGLALAVNIVSCAPSTPKRNLVLPDALGTKQTSQYAPGTKSEPAEVVVEDNPYIEGGEGDEYGDGVVVDEENSGTAYKGTNDEFHSDF